VLALIGAWLMPRPQGPPRSSASTGLDGYAALHDLLVELRFGDGHLGSEQRCDVGDTFGDRHVDEDLRERRHGRGSQFGERPTGAGHDIAAAAYALQVLRDQRPFTGNPYGLPDSLATQACGATLGCDASQIWDFTVPINTEGGDLTGFEVSYQQPFTFLPGVWSNFGTILNYTFVESEITYLTVPAPPAAPVLTAVTDDLTGLSKDAFNATLYFDNKTFSARVSAAYRADYLTTVPGRNGNDVEGTASTMNIDFSTSYNINDNFTVSLEALNLTDEVQDQWVSSTANRLSYYHHQGRQFYLGGRFKF